MKIILNGRDTGMRFRRDYPRSTKGLLAMDKAKKQKLVDVKCHELAVHFLSDDPPNGYFPQSLADEQRRIDDLATHVQQAVEDWFSAFKPYTD